MISDLHLLPQKNHVSWFKADRARWKAQDACQRGDVNAASTVTNCWIFLIVAKISNLRKIALIKSCQLRTQVIIQLSRLSGNKQLILFWGNFFGHFEFFWSDELTILSLRLMTLLKRFLCYDCSFEIAILKES